MCTFPGDNAVADMDHVQPMVRCLDDEALEPSIAHA